MTICILLIDDDPAMCRALSFALPRDRYKVHTAGTGEEGSARTALIGPDLVLLDLGLPDIDGIGVCQQIRSRSEVPIIVLSAADDEARKVEALDQGANDYITKPFGNAELAARIRVAVRRPATLADDSTSSFNMGPIQIDTVRREARLDGDLLNLTTREFGLLACLAKRAGRTCTHEHLLDEVWGTNYSKDTNYLHSYVHRLRQRLPSSTVRIETQPGIGYSINVR